VPSSRLGERYSISPGSGGHPIMTVPAVIPLEAAVQVRKILGGLMRRVPPGPRRRLHETADKTDSDIFEWYRVNMSAGQADLRGT
jgi:hypothetical protein